MNQSAPPYQRRVESYNWKKMMIVPWLVTPPVGMVTSNCASRYSSVSVNADGQPKAARKAQRQAGENMGPVLARARAGRCAFAAPVQFRESGSETGQAGERARMNRMLAIVEREMRKFFRSPAL